MTPFDLAVSLDQTTLNTAFAQFYAKPEARNGIFKGTLTRELGGVQIVVTYDFQQAPSFVIGPPSASDWSTSIDASGKNPTGPPPSTNAFTVMLPQFNGTVSIAGGTPVGGTTLVKVFATGAMGADGKATFTPLSVWLDESQMGAIDKAILNGLIIPQILATTATFLSGLTIIPPAISVGNKQIALTGQTMTIAASSLVLTASLAQGSGGRTVTAMPSQPLSVLMSPELLTAVASAGMVGSTSGGEGESTGTKYKYQITITSTTALAPAEGQPISLAIGLHLDAAVEILGGVCAATTAGSML